MTSTPRQRGDAFERRTRRQLVDAGYFTLRSSGSSGPFDLLALRRGELNLIQCKADGRLDPGEWDALLALATELGGLAILALKDERRHVEYRRLCMPKSWTAEERDGEPLWESWRPIVVVGW